LPPEEWKRVEKAVDRALAWLVSQQQPDGSFLAIDTGQPAVTSLCTLAFLSRGHQPGRGPYGAVVTKAIDYVLQCQQSDGLLCRLVPEQVHVHLGASHTGTYNHAIAGLMLAEVFGGSSGEQAKRIKLAIERGLRCTLRLQSNAEKRFPEDNGGWRYIRHYRDIDSDLSATGWQVMFLRSARNAEFSVPATAVDEAEGFVQRCFDERAGLFNYDPGARQAGSDRAMMGAGALSLSLGGKHQTEMARRAGEWLLSHPFNQYGQGDYSPADRGSGRFNYSAYYCSQAMAQLGGRYWQGFFPPLARTFVENQSENGSWRPEQQEDSQFGLAYSTALGVLTLTPPMQLLPIYQR
jgi:hypothetical protein